MSNTIVTKLKKYQKLLTDKNIKKILDNYKKDYIVKQVTEKRIILTKESESKYETVEIYDNSYVNHYICEKRPHGIIFTELEQSFDYTAYSKEEKQMVHLIEKRYVLTNSKLKKLFGDISHLSIKEIYEKLLTIPIILDADMKTHFSTYIDYMIKDSNGNFVQSYKLSTRAFINGTDISKIYDCINGNDRLYRVHDLYNGIINEKNKNDIQNIKNGILNLEAFDYKKTSGITDKENSLVGEPINKAVKDFFIEKDKKISKEKHKQLTVLTGITFKKNTNK